MANNSNRKAIEFMVQGALPPHSTNVLWMDTSVPELPVLKIFENGAWTNVHTEDSKSIELLAETVLAQQNEITELTEDISSKMALDATVAKEATLQAVEQDASAANIAAQALVPVAAAAEAYNTGKVQLAENITSKGVSASASETLPELAEKVNAIAQESYSINGGEMYAKQLLGSLETPNYWNLYEVLANLLSDGRLVSYGGILLAEYYRGYDSLALAGAGAGGAYVVSDKDENGQFIMYTNDTTHTWATEFDGKGNRWVAYCFADKYHDFQITDTDTSPRSIFIGRKVGVITCLVNTRVSKIVVPDGNELINFLSGTYTSQWDKSVIIRNINPTSGNIMYNPSCESVYISGKKAKSSFVQSNNSAGPSIIIIDYDVITSSTFSSGGNSGNSNLKTLCVKANEIESCYLLASNVSRANLLFVSIQAETCTNLQFATTDHTKYLTVIQLNYITNDKTKSFSFYERNSYSAWKDISDVELQQGWIKPLNIKYCTYLTKENVQAHIFDRLGVNDLSTGAVTITLATSVLNLFTQEEIDAVVARTNITIVGA